MGKIGSFAKLGLWVGWCGFANVPMCGWLKLFFKMCGGKNFKNIRIGLRDGLVLPCQFVKERFQVSPLKLSGCKVFVFQLSLSGLRCLFTLGHNVPGAGVRRVLLLVPKYNPKCFIKDTQQN